ncbi:spore germination protein GerPC [Virgibacillus soli]|uniref:spore germination protein GerPC n=1 Tax=Paracerasibacillus soli TaxID=480284 RepID=UPI0035EDA1C7
MNIHELYHYVYDLQHQNNEQTERIHKLEQQINSLEDKLNQPTQPAVDKIEYHFDQLKIEHLEGTLQIGLSPQDLANIDDLQAATSAQNNNSKQMGTLPQDVQHQLRAYLNEAGPQIIQQLANEYQQPIDEKHQAALVEDIQKQLPQRIAYYEQKARKQNIASNQELQAYLTENTKNEIHHSLRKYIEGITKQGDAPIDDGSA